MTFAVTARSLRSLGWVLPILAVLCCAPSVARAGCGDYVVTRGPHPANVASAAHQTEMPAPITPAPQKPCNGPNCKRAPAVPQPLPVPIVTPTGPSQWGWLTASPAPPSPHVGARLIDSPSPRPTHLASGIFHPPRAAA